MFCFSLDKKKTKSEFFKSSLYHSPWNSSLFIIWIKNGLLKKKSKKLITLQFFFFFFLKILNFIAVGIKHKKRFYSERLVPIQIFNTWLISCRHDNIHLIYDRYTCLTNLFYYYFHFFFFFMQIIVIVNWLFYIFFYGKEELGLAKQSGGKIVNKTPKA